MKKEMYTYKVAIALAIVLLLLHIYPSEAFIGFLLEMIHLILENEVYYDL